MAKLLKVATTDPAWQKHNPRSALKLANEFFIQTRNPSSSHSAYTHVLIFSGVCVERLAISVLNFIYAGVKETLDSGKRNLARF